MPHLSLANIVNARALCGSLGGAVVATLCALTFASPARAAFPGDDGRIGYASVRHPVGNNCEESSPYDIFTIRPNGDGRTRLTRACATETYPSYSANGKRIVYTRNADIWMMHADGSNQHRVMNRHTNITDAAPAFSPNGRWIAWQRADDVMKMRTDGSDRQFLADGLHPSWSPDGDWIAYQSDDFDYDIWKMRPSGANQQDLTANTIVEEQDPDWSPNGTEIAFFTNAAGNPNLDIAKFSADGGTQTPLVNSAARELYPAYSPNGDRLAYSKEIDNRWHLLRTAPGDDLILDTQGAAPSWQPR